MKTRIIAVVINVQIFLDRKLSRQKRNMWNSVSVSVQGPGLLHRSCIVKMSKVKKLSVFCFQLNEA
jgi:hypothetical protein